METPRAETTEEEVEREHAELGLPPVEEEVVRPGKPPLMQVVTYLVIAMLLALVAYFLYLLFIGEHERSGTEILVQTLHDRMFWSAVAVGFVAQMIDGALGMAYGVTASSFLLAAGAPPADGQRRHAPGRSVHHRHLRRLAPAAWATSTRSCS